MVEDEVVKEKEEDTGMNQGEGQVVHVAHVVGTEIDEEVRFQLSFHVLSS